MRNIYSAINTGFLIILLIVFCSPLSGQQQKAWQWINHLEGRGWDITSGIAADSKNNIYVAGNYTSGLEFKGTFIESTGNHDMFIARFNENGNLKWITGNGGAKMDRVNCITTGINDNVIVAGVINDSLKLGDLNITGEGERFFIATLDSKGKSIWIKVINHTQSASLYLIDADKEGNIYAGGVFKDKITVDDNEITCKGKNDVFILKLNASGNVIKLISYGGEGDENIHSLSSDNEGNIICAGSFTGSFNIDSVNINTNTPNKYGDTYIISFTGDITPKWTKIIRGEEYLKISSTKADSDNNIFITGNYNLSINVDGLKFISNGRTDIFLIKLSNNGNIIWARHYGSKYYDYAYNLNIDNLNGAYLTGSFGDSIQFDSIALIPTVSTNDAFVTQVTPEGNIEWATKISGTGKNFSKGAVLDKKGNLYITGSFKGKLFYGDKEIESLGEEDVFLAKYYNCPQNDVEIENTVPLCPGGGGELYAGHGFKDIIWNDTLPGSNRLIINKPGKYWVRMVDKRGCLVSDTTEVQQKITEGFSLGNDTILLINDSLVLNAPEGYNNYYWHDYSASRSYLARAPDRQQGVYEYWLCAVDSSGCQVSDTISIKYIDNLNWMDLSGDVTIVTYPNPALDRLYWYINTKNYGKLRLELTDEKGVIIYNEIVEKYIPGEIKQLDMCGLPSGAYYLSIAGEIDKKIIKIIHDQRN